MLHIDGSICVFKLPHGVLSSSGNGVAPAVYEDTTGSHKILMF